MSNTSIDSETDDAPTLGSQQWNVALCNHFLASGAVCQYCDISAMLTLGILPKATSRSVTMVPPQSLFRSPQRMILQIRSLSANRSLSQRRFAHIEGPQLTGAADNAFNRERQAVKAHAAATSGEILE